MFKRYLVAMSKLKTRLGTKINVFIEIEFYLETVLTDQTGRGGIFLSSYRHVFPERGRSVQIQIRILIYIFILII